MKRYRYKAVKGNAGFYIMKKPRTWYSWLYWWGWDFSLNGSKPYVLQDKDLVEAVLITLNKKGH